MSKLIKTLLAFAAVGTATAAGVAYYLKKTENDDDFLDEFEDEVGEPADDREYVSLNQTAEAAEESETDEEAPEVEAEEAVTETEEAEPAKEDEAVTEETEEAAEKTES